MEVSFGEHAERVDAMAQACRQLFGEAEAVQQQQYGQAAEQVAHVLRETLVLMTQRASAIDDALRHHASAARALESDVQRIAVKLDISLHAHATHSAHAAPTVPVPASGTLTSCSPFNTV